MAKSNLPKGTSMRRRLDRLIDIAARDHGRVGMVISLREADLGAMALDLARSEAKGYERLARAMRRASKRMRAPGA